MGQLFSLFGQYVSDGKQAGRLPALQSSASFSAGRVTRPLRL